MQNFNDGVLSGSEDTRLLQRIAEALERIEQLGGNARVKLRESHA